MKKLNLASKQHVLNPTIVAPWLLKLSFHVASLTLLMNERTQARTRDIQQMNSLSACQNDIMIELFKPTTLLPS
jgi:Na+-translocating ferredoxin:NAD+ oxidoreductase RnfD subunit